MWLLLAVAMIIPVGQSPAEINSAATLPQEMGGLPIVYLGTFATSAQCTEAAKGRAQSFCVQAAH